MVPESEKPDRYQRVGAISNTHAGRDFAEAVRAHFAKNGIALEPEFGVLVGYERKKLHKFDFGSDDPPLLIECKSYTWTVGGNSPSAKIRGMNEAMLLFSVAPAHFRKFLFVLKHMRREVSLAAHYVKTQGHLIGVGVELWELDVDSGVAERVN